jgi:hypothetical protein
MTLTDSTAVEAFYDEKKNGSDEAFDVHEKLKR